jgi:hypothetical protein
VPCVGTRGLADQCSPLETTGQGITYLRI